MRLIAREVTPTVTTNPDATRPIRLRLSGNTFGMDRTEAIELASALVAAVDQLGEAHT